ncbi:ABC transporter permease [Paraburkholderia nemoris]|uniref:ABC transporter permease n=1 Tax=Paraburkholderia nemoris TaxID=2793076 RepID=UPI0038B7DBDC
MSTLTLTLPRDHLLARLGRSPTFITGTAILGFWIFCALLSAHIVPFDPLADDMANSLAPPSAQHWFGTDQLGRDQFSRVLSGARDVLVVAPLVTLLATALGTVLGLVAAYFGGWVDRALSRLFDSIMAMPLTIMALVALSALGSSTGTVICVIAFAFAPMIARSVRTAARIEIRLDYVAAAEMRGESVARILFVEILPNIAPVLLVEGTLRLGYAVFSATTLSFLGFGIQPPSPDWGLAIAENYPLLIGGMWWTVVFDALATASLVIGTHLLAEALRKALSE